MCLRAAAIASQLESTSRKSRDAVAQALNMELAIDTVSCFLIVTAGRVALDKSEGSVKDKNVLSVFLAPLFAREG
jgi:C4-dicarboxylate-specific signal transduction histidine kinase